MECDKKSLVIVLRNKFPWLQIKKKNLKAAPNSIRK